MAQGAKPGEGGQLPGAKVLPWIAEKLNSICWINFSSSIMTFIEDLSQLIFDLKMPIVKPASMLS
jgi:glutamate synthase (ferredoxin)